MTIMKICVPSLFFHARYEKEKEKESGTPALRSLSLSLSLSLSHTTVTSIPMLCNFSTV